MTSPSAHRPHGLRHKPPRSSPEMVFVAERLTAWLAAACGAAGVLVWLLVIEGSQPRAQQLLVALGLCTTLTCAGLIAARNSRGRQVRDRQQRARPAAEELQERARPLDEAYISGMRSWITSVVALIDHATECGPAPAVRTDLESAAADGRELLELLAETAPGALSIHDRAKIHSLCTLWDTDVARIEQLASSLDPGWHRRWSARSVADRRLRHQPVSVPVQDLPYCR